MEEKKEKSKVKFFTVLKYFWPAIKKYQIFVYLVFLGSGIAIYLNMVWQPVIYKNIIDIVSSAPAPFFSQEIKKWLSLLVVALIGNLLAWRVSDYALVYSKTKITKTLTDESFSRIIKHSKNFFCQ